MSANDILDVLNVQRDQNQQQPAKKKQRVDALSAGVASSQKGMSRELYNLLGPNTPPINLGSIGGNGSGGLGNEVSRIKHNARPSPWTRMEFRPQGQVSSFSHWMKGSKELLESEEQKGKGYFFDKFNTTLSLPDLVDKEVYESYLVDFKEAEMKERERVAMEKARLKERAIEKQKEKEEKEKEKERERLDKEKASKHGATAQKPSTSSSSETGSAGQEVSASTSTSTVVDVSKKESGRNDSESAAPKITSEPSTAAVPDTASSTSKAVEKPAEASSSLPDKNDKESIDSTSNEAETTSIKPESEVATKTTFEVFLEQEPIPEEFSYEETVYLFDLCKAFELKWYIITDRYSFPIERSQEDLKEHYYRVCYKILETESNSNPNLLASLKSFSKTKEVERKQYLENLLKRTPAEIAEEESLVIEARRFELAAKKMLVERSYLLNLLDSPQTSQSIQQYQSSQGLATLYSNLMIIDKHQKKRQQQQLQKQAANGNGSNSGGSASSGLTGQSDPVPPAIPIAASSSFKKERTFQTHLQQYLSGVLKQQGISNNKHEASPIQQLLSKRLTVKEEEAYGLHYHANDKIMPGVTLRSAQKLPGLQQRQSVLKSVNALLQEMDIPTAGGMNWKPAMPTRKTMSKYDSLLRAVVALLDVKKGRDKLESEIKLIKSQRNL